MATGISFGHFNIVAGVVREDGPYVVVLEDRSPAEALTDLYVVLEPARPGSEVFCPELLRVIDGQFGRPQYSLTGNLLQALRAAQEHLRAWNKAAPPEQRAAVGTSCLAVSGAEAYLAQVGPGVAYLRHGGHLSRLEALETDAQAPLGTTLACAPSFSRLLLSQGDTILLVSSSFAASVEDETTDLILSLPPGEALPEIYRLVRRESEFSALYLAVTGDLNLSDDREPEIEREQPEPGAGIAGGGRPDRTARISVEEAVSLDDEVSGFQAAQSLLESTEQRPNNLRGSGSVLNRSRQIQRHQLDRLTERHAIVLPRPALYTLAVVIVLALAGWFGLPSLLQTGRQDRFAGLLRDARSSQQTAASVTDPSRKRTLLVKAQADLDEAGRLRAPTGDYTAVQAENRRALETLNAVRQLPSPATLLDLTTTPISPRSATEILAGAQLYLLDSSTGKVYAFPLAPAGSKLGAPAVIFEADKLVESIPSGHAQHLAWQAPASGTAGQLYILDDNRRLFSYDGAGTTRAVGLLGTQQWKSAAAIAASSGQLYVLDSSGNQIWKYAASNGGFVNPPSPLLTKVNLHDAAQMTIAGDLYVGTLSGRLLRFSGGRETEVKLNGIDRPLVSAQPPVADPATGLHYIGDPGNQRIVASDALDVYRSQFVGSALHGLRTITLDVSTGTLYAISEQNLIAAVVR